ncbi:MAG: hypothetical protein WCK35_17665 [Chloroflexota bacterium]
MSQCVPVFINSPYFIDEFDNWHLTDDAPEDVIREFIEYMNGEVLTEKGKKYIKKLQQKLENK